MQILFSLFFSLFNVESFTRREMGSTTEIFVTIIANHFSKNSSVDHSEKPGLDTKELSQEPVTYERKTSKLPSQSKRNHKQFHFTINSFADSLLFNSHRQYWVFGNKEYCGVKCFLVSSTANNLTQLEETGIQEKTRLHFIIKRCSHS